MTRRPSDLLGDLGHARSAEDGGRAVGEVATQPRGIREDAPALDARAHVIGRTVGGDDDDVEAGGRDGVCGPGCWRAHHVAFGGGARPSGGVAWQLAARATRLLPKRRGERARPDGDGFIRGR
jgi:hypothetical protein